RRGGARRRRRSWQCYDRKRIPVGHGGPISAAPSLPVHLDRASDRGATLWVGRLTERPPEKAFMRALPAQARQCFSSFWEAFSRTESFPNWKWASSDIPSSPTSR